MTPKKPNTLQEWRIHKEFKSVCRKHKLHLSRDVRITDLIPSAENHLSIEDYRFLIHSKFDYAIAPLNAPPLFLVDFSNPIHYRETCRRNDEILNSLCNRFRIPLLRINADHLFRHQQHLHLISRLIEIWFGDGTLRKNREEGSGNRPNLGKGGILQAYNCLSTPSELRLINIARKDGKRFQGDLSLFLGKDAKKILHGIGWFRISEESGIIAHVTMRNLGFPISEACLLTVILRFQAFEKLHDCYIGTGRTVPMETIEKSVRLFKERLSPLSFNDIALRRPAGGGDSS